MTATPTAATPARLLVVDDIEMNRDLLSRRLRRLGHEVTSVASGREALELVAANPMDLVLLDVMMPELDGYQVLEQLKASEVTRHVPVIMVSALDELQSVIRCIELGAEDYLPKPFDPVLLKARVGACLEKKRLRDQERLWAASMARELEIGRTIQAGFFPDSIAQPAGWEIAAYFQSARQVAGDFYDAFPLAGGRMVALVVGDVCDKGVGAALFMALFRSLLRAVAAQDVGDGGPSRAVADGVAASLGIGGDGDADALAGGAASILHGVTVTNDYIARTHGAANMFCTLFVAALDPVTGAIAYVNGGHEPPVIVGSAGVRAQLTRTGPAVGMLPDIPFSLGTDLLAAGESLVIFTDGVTEARSAEGALFGDDTLLALVAEPASGSVELLARIRSALDAHTAGAERSDDITMLSATRLG